MKAFDLKPSNAASGYKVSPFIGYLWPSLTLDCAVSPDQAPGANKVGGFRFASAQTLPLNALNHDTRLGLASYTVTVDWRGKEPKELGYSEVFNSNLDLELGLRRLPYGLYPEADMLWPEITKKLDAYIHKSIWECNPKFDAYELDPEPNRQACALLKNEIMDDKAKFDGATIEEIMNHYVDLMGYRDWNELPDFVAPKLSPFCTAHPHINRHMCLLIDQEVLEAVRDAPTPLPKTDEPVLYIKAVDSHFSPQWDEYPPEYTGWAFVNARSLWYLHQDLGGDSLLGDRMHEGWGADFDGKAFRYTAE